MPAIQRPFGAPKITDDVPLKGSQMVDDPSKGEGALQLQNHVVCDGIDVVRADALCVSDE